MGVRFGACLDLSIRLLGAKTANLKRMHRFCPFNNGFEGLSIAASPRWCSPHLRKPVTFWLLREGGVEGRGLVLMKWSSKNPTKCLPVGTPTDVVVTNLRPLRIRSILVGPLVRGKALMAVQTGSPVPPIDSQGECV